MLNARLTIAPAGDRWLSVHARRTRAALGGPSLRSIRASRVISNIQPIVRGNWSFGVLVAALTMVLVLPLPWSFPSLLERENAVSFLQVLWQIEAAVLALSVAIILFAFESFARGPLQVPLQESVRSSNLLPLLHLGIATLLLDGMVLLGLGDDAPAQWPATWATIVTLLAIASLFLMFLLAIAALDINKILAKRVRSARRQARRIVDDSVLERIALNDLTRLAPRLGVGLALGPSPQTPPGWNEISAPRGGRVQDINLHRLARVSQRARRLNAGQPILAVRIGELVHEGRLMLLVPPVAPVDLLDAEGVILLD